MWVARIHIGASAPRSCWQRSAPRRTRASTCWFRSGRLYGERAGSCRWRWRVPPRIHSPFVDSTRGETTSEQTTPAYIPWICAGAVCFAVQGLMFISTISIYRQATSANVLYSSRGLWSVVAVWGVGHWFTNREQHLGARVLAGRLVGAILLMAAIAMVLLD